MSLVDLEAKSLILGNSNQMVKSDEKYYNLEEYRCLMQVKGPWDTDRIVEINIVKIFNTCTMYISSIEGQAKEKATATLIDTVPFTLPVPTYDGVPQVNYSGKLPQRFLPRNNPTDLFKSNDPNIAAEPFFKTYPVPGSQSDIGYAHALFIRNRSTDIGDNGKITWGFNMSAAPFTNKNVTLGPTSISYLTNSNINLSGTVSVE